MKETPAKKGSSRARHLPLQAHWLWLALPLLAWALALGVDRHTHRNARSAQTAALQDRLLAQEASLAALATDPDLLSTLETGATASPVSLEALTELPFATFVTRGDSLLAWNRGVPGMEPAALAGSCPEAAGLLRLPDGDHLRLCRQSGELLFHALLPLRHRYAIGVPHLQPWFPALPGLPGEVTVSAEPTPYPLALSSGQAVAWLDFSAAPSGLPREYLPLLLYLLAGLLTLAAAHWAAAALIARGWRRVGPPLFLGAVFGLRGLSITLDFTGHFQGLPLFGRALDHPLLSYSIGDLLINISLLLWVIIFCYREVAIPDLSALDRRRRLLVAWVNYTAIALGLLAIVHLFQVLVLESDLSFRFDDIFHFSTLSFLSLLAVQMMLIALFLYSYRLLLFINRTGLERGARLLTLLPAAAAAFAAGLALDIPLQPALLGALLIGYLLLFEFYADIRVSNLTWTILWMILFSGLASGLLYRFNEIKVGRRLETSAARLHDLRDATLERQLDSLLAGGGPAALMTSPYARQHYRLEGPDMDSLATGWRWVFDTPSGEYLLFREGPYTLRLRHGSGDGRRVYAELLDPGPFKGIADLGMFRYRLRRGGVVLQGDLSEEQALGLATHWGKEEGYRHFRQGNIRGVVLREGARELMIVHESGGRSAYLSLFSYLFCLLTVTLFLVTLLNTLFAFLPDTLNFSLSHRLSLRNRIQFSVISLIVLSFLIIGAITIFFFRNTGGQYHSERMQRLAANVSRDLEARLADSSATDLVDLLQETGRVHETDIDLYDGQGRFLAGSEPMVHQAGIVGGLMEGRALAALRSEGKTVHVGESRVGSLAYRTAWIPLATATGTMYAGIPYYTDRSFLQKDISEFISALLNVYVFLLFIAAALAILVANSITFPLSVIGEKLKQFKLGKQNEPLEWTSRDELGELISEYNRMIRKLQESAELLARSEREGAWREMARQVAHEIKNPLTPMKLSLQHLQHAFRPEREEDRQLLKRVSATLIEQIENLSQIASEFSNFAKIPEASPEEIAVNELLRSVHNLFSESDPQGLRIETDIPDAEVRVVADRNQLLRVLNNLVKNATQAIPEGRMGRIRIGLRTEGGVARIEVEDNGTGIAEEMREKVFIPNFTTKSSGTGLGLAICRNMIDQMHGRIWFVTHPGEGTTFFVELPLA